MQKATLAVLMLLSFVSVSMAQPAAPAVKPAPMAVKMFAGKVEAIVTADPIKNTKASITVIDEKQMKGSFAVTPATVIADAADKTIAFGALAVGTPVKVAFVSKDAVNEAVAVKLLK